MLGVVAPVLQTHLREGSQADHPSNLPLRVIIAAEVVLLDPLEGRTKESHKRTIGANDPSVV